MLFEEKNDKIESVLTEAILPAPNFIINSILCKKEQYLLLFPHLN